MRLSHVLEVGTGLGTSLSPATSLSLLSSLGCPSPPLAGSPSLYGLWICVCRCLSWLGAFDLVFVLLCILVAFLFSGWGTMGGGKFSQTASSLNKSSPPHLMDIALGEVPVETSQAASTAGKLSGLGGAFFGPRFENSR